MDCPNAFVKPVLATRIP